MKKINIIDIFIILLVLFIIIIGSIYVSGRNVSGDNDTILYNVTVENISLETASEMEVGENLYNSVNGKLLGVIKDLKISEQTENFFDRSIGEYKQVVKPEEYKVELVVQSEAEKSGGIYVVADLKINIGRYAYLRGKNYVCQGKILNILEVIADEK